MNDNSVSVCAGLDYHACWTQVCILSEDGQELCNKRVPSEPASIAATIARFGTPRIVAIEACSGAATLAQQLNEGFGFMTKLSHPGYVKRMRHSPDKSDLSDARILAELGRNGFLPEVWLAPESIRELRFLVHRRSQVVQQRRAAKVRLLALLREMRIARPQELNTWTRPWRKWVRTEAPVSEMIRWIIGRHLDEIDQANVELAATQRMLRTVTADDPVVSRLMGFAGIGEVTAWVLRAEIGRFSRFRDGKQLSRYCGLSPRNASSGHRVADAGLIKAGRPLLRSVIIQAAHRLVIRNVRWKAMFDRLVARGKHPCVAIAAVANRWVRSLHHQMAPIC